MHVHRAKRQFAKGRPSFRMSQMQTSRRETFPDAGPVTVSPEIDLVGIVLGIIDVIRPRAISGLAGRAGLEFTILQNRSPRGS